MKYKIFFILLFSSIAHLAQTYDGWNEFIHTRNTYTPVESSMLNMPSYINPSFYAHTYNPSLAGLVKGSGVETSFFSYDPSEFAEINVKTFSGNFRINDNNSVGLSYFNYNINYKPGFFTEDFDFSTFTLSYSRKITENISAGVGVNYMESNEVGQSTMEIYTLDIGGVYSDEFQPYRYIKSNLVASVSVDNLAGSVKEELKLGTRKVSEYTDVYPVFLNAGVAYQIVVDTNWYSYNMFALNLQVNYRNSLNDPYYEYLHVGAEFRFIEMIYLRFGHVEFLTGSLRDMMGDGFPGNSYGLGLELPVSDFFNMEVDWKLQFNYGQSYNLLPEGGITELNSYSIGIILN